MALLPLGAGGSAIGLSAADAYENVTLPAVKGECQSARMVAVASEKMRVISMGYLSCLLNCRLYLMRFLTTFVRAAK
jgi:hypothetical protein